MPEPMSPAPMTASFFATFFTLTSSHRAVAPRAYPLRGFRRTTPVNSRPLGGH